MRTPGLSIVALATGICLLSAARATAVPFRLPLDTPAAFTQVTCRAPPWYRGWQGLAPYVCGDFWWWPRYYYRGIGMRHRYHHRFQ
jgi:hypothetical protein